MRRNIDARAAKMKAKYAQGKPKRRKRRNGKTINPTKRYLGDQLPKGNPAPLTDFERAWMNRGTRY